MIKKILFLILFCSFAYSQSIGIGGGVSYPTGKFEAGVNFGYNAGLTVHLMVFGVHGVCYAAYQLWDEKTVENESGYKAEVQYKNFPIVLIGARKYFGKAYVSAMAGIYPVDLKIKETRGDEVVEYNPTTTQGSLMPGAGYIFPFQNFKFDLNAGYLWNEDYAQIIFTASILL